MPTFIQVDRPLAITTPLGRDALLLVGFQGREAVSRLFRFRLALLAPRDKPVAFDKLLGQEVTVSLALEGGGTRHFHGLVRRLTQGRRDTDFLHYQADMVPRFWLWTRKVQSRIFQHLSVPDILKQVLQGLNVRYQVQGAYQPRDYCVQYRESDFAFASRLMEEEGIRYFFEHADGRHTLIVTDLPLKHPEVPVRGKVLYDEVRGGGRAEGQVRAWRKAQQLRCGKYTLWDHCFELPGKNLEAGKATQESVKAGQVSHALKVGGNERLEIYDYPGGYAQRFDGVEKHGGERPAELQRIFEDNRRTVQIRMEQEALPGLEIRGASGCGQFSAGHQFSLQRHFDGDGDYVLTRVEHHATLGAAYRSGDAIRLAYRNRFRCIPAGLPLRPLRVTRRPIIPGPQTATVVGPAGEEIFCDKYGRVKVQFHWDRQGKHDADSSCWIRVAQAWAGKGWGAFFWPRSGHEVVVAFEEGDPDQPLIVGSVYNAANMPPFALPLRKTFCGFKSASVRGKAHENFNGILFVDEKGHEHLAIHSERHLIFNAEYDKLFRAGRHQGERVPGARTATIGTLPGGGGSGGGAPDSSFGPPNYLLWQRPEPHAVLGLNSTVVYGGNFQFAVPLNCQVALGSNLQVCINPFSWADVLPGGTAPPLGPTAAQLLGSGAGGNMQLTLGTNTNFVIGQSYDITVGPQKFEIPGGISKSTSTLVLSGVLIAVTIAFTVAYGCLYDDDARAILVAAFQGTLQVLLIGLMDLNLILENADYEAWTKYWEFFGPSLENALEDTLCGLVLSAAMAGASLVGTMVVPVLLEAAGEVTLDSEGDDSVYSGAKRSHE